MSDAARRVRVTGRVQGVFFRAWTREQAKRLGIFGWVRNCADGSVEALLCGEEAALSQMIAAMRRGPPHAQVEDISVERAEAEPGSGFSIRD